MSDQGLNHATDKNRRSLKNIMVSPAGQIRLLFGVPLAALAAVTFLLLSLNNAVSTRIDDMKQLSGLTPASLDDLKHVVTHITQLGCAFTLVGFLMIATFGLLISHRFYGPLVPILRTVQAMKKGDYSERIHLRSPDELKELARELNELCDVLAAKK
jgi:signal transduction histidine kinase